MGREITFVEIDAAARKRLANFPRTIGLSRAMYSRLLLPDLIPQKTGRLLYPDSDMVVRSSLRPLFAVPLNGHALGAVEDAPEAVPVINARLGRPPNTPYLNSGLLLIDLEKWRSANLGERSMAYIETTAHGYPDQDAINLALGTDWAVLERKWNLVESEAARFPRSHYEKAAIIHFTWRKPNHPRCDHPARDMYFAQRQNTPWKDRPLVSDLRRRLGRETFRLGLKLEGLLRKFRVWSAGTGD